MFDLFRREPKLNVAVVQPPAWPYIQKAFQKNIEKVMTYHRMYPKPVKSNHILIRLLHSLGIPKRLPLERYYAGVDTVGLNVSKVMKMTSSINNGVFFKGTFYGPECKELLIAVDDYFDFEEADKNWRNVRAVTPLLHPKSDLDIHLANGESYSAENGLAITMINVPMLAIQFRGFWNEQRIRAAQGHSVKTISQFIAGYVIPNMLPRQMDLNLLNRLMNKRRNINDGKNVSFRNHSFTLTEYTPHIDKTIDKVLINIDKASPRFDIVLRQIPSFYNDDIYPALILPDVAPTMQVSWSMILTRLKVTDFLFEVCEDELEAKNQSTIAQMLRAFRANSSYYMLETMLPKDIYLESESYIDNILEAVNRNTF